MLQTTTESFGPTTRAGPIRRSSDLGPPPGPSAKPHAHNADAPRAEGPTMSRQPSRTGRRRAPLARRFEAIEAMEHRSLITESLGILTAGIGIPAAMIAARTEAGTAQVQASQRREPALPVDAAWPAIPASSTPGGKGSTSPTPTSDIPLVVPSAPSGTAMAIPAANPIRVSWAVPADSSKGGGAGGTSHGGSGATTPAAVPSSSSPAGTSSSSPSSPSVVIPTDMSNSTSSTSVNAAPTPTTSPTSAQASAASDAMTGAVTPSASPSGPTSSSATLSSFRAGGFGASADAMTSFANFPVYTLDENAGSVLLPNTERLATLGGNMDLRAQVDDTTVASYSWDTSGLTDATDIAGSSTYDLTFQWDSSVSAATTNSATLTVTNTGGQTETQTYTFQVPAGSGTAGTGTASWPQSLSPDTVSPSAPAVAVQDGSVDSNSGALDTSITLPTYNPNVPAVVLSYDSETASPTPLIVEHDTIDPTQAVPSVVSAQLTFDGSTGSTYDYNTSQLSGGDVQQIALQADATSLATGRYPYSITLGATRSGSTTTSTVTGTTTVINDSASAVGSGWSVAGLETIIPASGGVILDLGSGGSSLWFASGSGSTYTSPAGEFSTLVADAGGGYTRTLTDGETIKFNASGEEISNDDANGVGLAYAYDSSGRLSTIEDAYGNTTTFSYDGTTGLLDSITDPAGRVTSFTHSGTILSGVTLPDSSTWGYAYNGSGELTGVTDPNGNAMTVAYDAANRVGTITNPDSTTETFVAAQEQGFVPAGSGTSSSPAAATLLATASSTFIDQEGNETDLYPDWQGLGLTDVTSDPLGNVTTAVRDGNGLATVVVDPLNRITQYSYDTQGSVTRTINPDGTMTSATYNSFAEPLTTTDELGRTYTYTYDADGNQTSVTDPLGNVTTAGYTSTGQVGSEGTPSSGGSTGSQTIGSGSPNMSHYTYNSDGELIGSVDPDGNSTSYTYNLAGDKTSVTDPDGGVTSYTYDAMGRVLTTTDALGDTTTDIYNAAGRLTVVINPLGQRTTTTYDSMGRVSTVTDADGGVTSYTYDADGREASVTDPDGNTTSYTYDADGDLIATTDPNGYTSTESYDADGEVITSVDNDGRQINYSYNSMGKEVAETWIGSTGTAIETIASTYNAAGELTSITDGTTTLSYTYDADGNQLTASTSGVDSGQPSVTLTSSYAPDGSLVSLSDNLSTAGTTTYTYDAADRLTNLSASYGGDGGPQVALGYDAAGNLTSISRTDSAESSGGTGTGTGTGTVTTESLGPVGGTGIGGGGGSSASTTVTTSLVYDAADRVTSITGQANGSTLDAQSYSYDAADLLTSQTNAEGTSDYSYDADGQLTGVTGAGAASYSYDANGNRTMTGYLTGTDNETTSGAGYTYTYDPDGNMISKTQTSTGDVWTYTWDYRNRLTGVVETNSSGTVLVSGTYTYDPMNRRIGVDETVGGVETKTYTVYDGDNPYADFSASGALEVRYLYGPAEDQILARTSASGTTAWYLTDDEGSVRDVVSTSGAVLDHIAYDAYGNVTSESDASEGDRFKFDGMVWDEAIGLYYDNARYYDPNSGKFVSQDPTGQSTGEKNDYEFTGNDPSNNIDINGYDYWDFNFGADGLGVGVQIGQGPNGPSIHPYVGFQLPGGGVTYAPDLPNQTQTVTPGLNGSIGYGGLIPGTVGAITTALGGIPFIPKLPPSKITTGGSVGVGIDANGNSSPFIEGGLTSPGFSAGVWWVGMDLNINNVAADPDDVDWWLEHPNLNPFNWF
jgi:RHS repeat-associated protein